MNTHERALAIGLSLLVAFLGLLMAGFGVDGLFNAHGFLILVLALGMAFGLMRRLDAPEEQGAYRDGAIRAGIVLSVLWALVGMFFGAWVSWLFVFPDLTTDIAALSFGRIRPIHTTGVIFGFGGNALIATSLYVAQRTAHARMRGGIAAWFVLSGYNLFCILAVSGYMLGITQSKEYAEPEWYADLLLVVVWLTYFWLVLSILAHRREPHIYVSNWYYLAFILVVAILHVFNNLAVPVSWLGARSTPVFAGVQDAMVQWWYGHNAVAFFLTAGFLGMMYYFLPKRAGRPVFSYRTSIVSFWGIAFFYMWAGSHHLHFTALPQWVQSLGMTFSLMLLIPSWASAANALLTLNGAWHKVRSDATLRFMMVAAVFYGISTFEGSFMAIRAVNSLSHYTDWTIGHVHAGALGWVAMITFGSIYALVPWLWNRPGMASPRLVEWHFWLAMGGMVLYLLSMWNAGIVQGLMWRAYGPDGLLAYSFMQSLEAISPYYLVRALGGTLFLLGAMLCAVNLWLTIRRKEEAPLPAAALHTRTAEIA